MNMQRREFLELLQASAAVAAMGGPLSTAARGEAVADRKSLSPAVTVPDVARTSLVSDCIRLALHDGAVCRELKTCLGKNEEIVLLAGVVRATVSRLLAEFQAVRRARPDFGQPDSGQPDSGQPEQLQQRLALLVGCVCYRAADLHLATTFRPDAGGDAASVGERRIYQTAFLLREVYGNGRRAACEVDELEDLLGSLWQRTLVGWHTFKPDHADVEAWIGRLAEARRQIASDARRFAAAFCRPDPEKMKRLVIDASFYDRNDTLIRLARSLRRGAAEQTIDLRKVLAAAENQSLYARALHKGCLDILACNDYLESRADHRELRSRLKS
jgi:hypothetical protein